MASLNKEKLLLAIKTGKFGEENKKLLKLKSNGKSNNRKN